MLSHLKLKLANFLQWQTALGSRSTEVLDRIAELSQQNDTYHQRLLQKNMEALDHAANISQRFDSYSRLHAQNLDVLTETASALRKEIAQQAERHQILLARIEQCEKSLLERIEQSERTIFGHLERMGKVGE
ncbi:hypothetical protein [Methylovirgula sp. 4M-Z18]|uniref:hypothetical protein n=1 Tax=Methylovirgula sp. 4M-Z18 TaxID=2293567 RepID=UPI000E2FAE20|nr:hypothetical protein [Methylovirgula sp. 4M-Z18]RFB80352.1 hypothetical protein DYH55_02165 [Methylovirgula sp. 4M-Z18]